jgi:hypothetical protein
MSGGKNSINDRAQIEAAVWLKACVTSLSFLINCGLHFSNDCAIWVHQTLYESTAVTYFTGLNAVFMDQCRDL